MLLLEDAIAYAKTCVRKQPDDWTAETLSHNVETNFPELDADECDCVALVALLH